MVTIEREKLEQVLEALDNLLYWDNGKSDYDQAREAVTAIKEALEQPAQELPPLTDADRRSYQKGHDAGVAHHKQAIGERNFCHRCGKRLQGVLGQPQVHTCTPPLWGHK